MRDRAAVPEGFRLGVTRGDAPESKASSVLRRTPRNPMSMMDTPVLFLIFNRPEPTEKIWDLLRKIRPATLRIAADGPREGRADDFRNCAETRRIVQRIDWKCDVKYRFLEKNYGCRRAVSSAIDWFFSEFEEGIILEDDCLPHREFFSFCSAALKTYRFDERVMHVNGTVHFAPDSAARRAWFSRYALVWGWASWRRAWAKYDPRLFRYPFDALSEVFSDAEVLARWRELLKKTADRRPGFDDTWDFQWSAALFAADGVAVSPPVNLIRNIGMESGTHEMPDGAARSAAVPRTFSAAEITFPPASAMTDPGADARIFDMIYRKKALLSRIAGKIGKRARNGENS